MATGNADRAASSAALSPVGQPREPQPAGADFLLEALATVQDHAADLNRTIAELHRYLEELQTPGTLKTIRLTAATPVVRDEVGDSQSAKSIGVINPNAGATIYVGIGGARAAANSEALSVPASAVMVLPVFVESLEIGTDPAAVASADAVVFLIRFKTVQPLFFGQY